MASPDSIRLVRSTIERSAGGHVSGGKLAKTTGNRFIRASESGTIPSKYQTYFYENTERKGFSTKTPRFADAAALNENPGPAAYAVSWRDRQESYSTRGTGGFASKTRRFRRQKVENDVGPVSYDPIPALPGYNKPGTSRNFCPPIAVEHKGKFINPAPNAYSVEKARQGPGHNASAQSSFKSTTRRSLYDQFKQGNPSPCHYIVRDDILHKSCAVSTSGFKSQTQRMSFMGSSKNPGPGSYDPFEKRPETVSKQILPRKCYLNFSAPAMPMPGPPASPGPGHYNVTRFIEPEKEVSSGAVFRSRTSRWNRETMKGDCAPGPGAYRPRAGGKQSFIFNYSNRWV